MSLQSSNFIVNRDGTDYRCPGSQLKSSMNQFDTMLLQRNGVQYKTKLAVNLDVIETASQTTVDLDYKQYAFVRDRDTGETLEETSPPFADAQQELRVYEHMFDGDVNTSFKSYTNSGIKHDVVVQFPEPIDVYGSITIKAGFHNNQRLGQMLINGQVVLELSAWDSEPEVFTVPFAGQVSEFSIRQKNLNGNQCTAVINYIDIDGQLLKSDVTATRLVMSPGTDMSRYKINMRLKKNGTDITGVIGQVDDDARIITLTTAANFVSGDEVLIDQIDGIAVGIPDISDTDLFVCTDTDDVTYKVTGQQIKTLLM